MRISLIIIFLLASGHLFLHAGPAESIVADLAKLKSADDVTWWTAVKNLVAAGPEVIPRIRRQYSTLTDLQRERIVPVLAGLKVPEADTMLVDLAVSDPDETVRKAALAEMKKNLSPSVRKYLIEKTRDPVPPVSNNAVGIIKKLNRFDLLKELVDELEKQQQTTTEKTRNVTLDMNLTNRKLHGFTNYPNQTAVNTPKGPVTVNNNIRMPEFTTASIQTRVTLPLTRVLYRVTGKNYGDNIVKWRKWLEKQRNKSEQR